MLSLSDGVEAIVPQRLRAVGDYEIDIKTFEFISSLTQMISQASRQHPLHSLRPASIRSMLRA